MLKSLIIRGSFDDMGEVVRIAKAQGSKIIGTDKFTVPWVVSFFYKGEIVWVAVIDKKDDGDSCKTPLVVGGKGENDKQ